MVVGRSDFDAVLEKLKNLTDKRLALDTETSGLRPWHGDRLFSIILATAEDEYYFNFQSYDGLDWKQVLVAGHYWQLHEALFTNPAYSWFIHNAKFDMAMLWAEGTELAGEVWCTQSLARIERNDHFKYDLDSCAERIGEKKDDRVKQYILDNKLWDWVSVPGKKSRKKNLHFDRVPFELISEYGCTDGRVGYRLGRHQEKALQGIADATPPTLPSVLTVASNERRLTKTLFRMERTGLLIDRPYCVRATQYENDRAEKAAQAFKADTGTDFSDSNKLFQAVFADDRERWGATEKGNPSFESDVLTLFSHPAAKQVLVYRDAKSKANFYQGFLYHQDGEGRVHPQIHQGGTLTGRCSSSDPNFQNLTNEEEVEEQEFLVRRAIIPSPGFFLASLDFDQMEYRKMLGCAKERELILQIQRGLDIHEATAIMMFGKCDKRLRKFAKTLNFMLLYGGGAQKLADALGLTLLEAKKLKALYFAKLPGVEALIGNISKVARERGYIRNWFGRRTYFDDPEFAYKAPNAYIQGGCADVMKIAMNRVDDFLLEGGFKTRMILQVHDDIDLEVAHGEEHVIPKIKDIMESVYPKEPLALTVSVSVSNKSLADLAAA